MNDTNDATWLSKVTWVEYKCVHLQQQQHYSVDTQWCFCLLPDSCEAEGFAQSQLKLRFITPSDWLLFAKFPWHGTFWVLLQWDLLALLQVPNQLSS
jgi:hypothetical protein